MYVWSSSWKIRAEILKQKAQSGMADSGCLDKNRRELEIHAELKGKCKHDSCFRLSPVLPSISQREGLLVPSAGFTWDLTMESTRIKLVSPYTVASVLLLRRKLKTKQAKQTNKKTPQSMEMNPSSRDLYCTLGRLEHCITLHFRNLYLIALAILTELCCSTV